MGTEGKLIFVYVLKCSNGKYYVGRTTRLAARFSEHWNGEGAEWTKLYPPIRVERVIETHSTYEEGNYVKEYMHMHGIDNVRGGPYVTATLTKDQIHLINKEIREAKNLCMICGSAKHFCNQCPSKITASPVTVSQPKSRRSPSLQKPLPKGSPSKVVPHTKVVPTKVVPVTKVPSKGSPPKVVPHTKAVPTKAVPTKSPKGSPPKVVPQQRRYNAHRSPSPIGMLGKVWTKEEEDTLREEYNKGYDIETLATYHQRTQRAIEMKLTAMGYDT